MMKKLIALVPGAIATIALLGCTQQHSTAPAAASTVPPVRRPRVPPQAAIPTPSARARTRRPAVPRLRAMRP